MNKYTVYVYLNPMITLVRSKQSSRIAPPPKQNIALSLNSSTKTVAPCLNFSKKVGNMYS